MRARQRVRELGEETSPLNCAQPPSEAPWRLGPPVGDGQTPKGTLPACPMGAQLLLHAALVKNSQKKLSRYLHVACRSNNGTGCGSRPVSCRWIIAMLLTSTDEGTGPDPHATGAKTTGCYLLLGEDCSTGEGFWWLGWVPGRRARDEIRRKSGPMVPTTRYY